MRVINDALLAEFRIIGCAWCLKPLPTEAAHLWARGMDGGGQLDIRVNLISLCRLCHQTSHDRPCHADLLLLVAQRESVLQPDIEAVVYMLRRLSKRPSQVEIMSELLEMGQGAAKLALKTLAEVPDEQQSWRVVA